MDNYGQKDISEETEKMIESSARDFLEGQIKDTQVNAFTDKQKKIDDLIKNANNQVLINVLSPQIEKNEKVKRYHKSILLILLTVFLVAQFSTVFVFTNKTLNYIFSKEVNAELVNASFAFITGYITSVVVELIAILRYIIQNVFDTSISELVKVFKEELVVDKSKML